ncbi:hypothetical protein Tco_0705343 [Tanacetum coccineum]|uniref:Uncharacterized protein n=1 Tax=Tanacetum coccineum TaxID=301880 RepID=A0ABQ4Y5S7_9ASTR
MWNLRRIMELRDSAQSNNWSNVLSLYFWRAKEANLRMARMINNVSVKLRAAIEEYQLFTQELEASSGWLSTLADSHGWSSGFFSMASLASSIFIFIVKSLQFEHCVFPGLSAALEDPEEELAREKEFEGVAGPEKELAFPKVISSFHLKYPHP